jgi:hypothetical protein
MARGLPHENVRKMPGNDRTARRTDNRGERGQSRFRRYERRLMVHLRSLGATVDNLRGVNEARERWQMNSGLPTVARPKGERRLVDQRGFEPLTS